MPVGVVVSGTCSPRAWSTSGAWLALRNLPLLSRRSQPSATRCRLRHLSLGSIHIHANLEQLPIRLPLNYPTFWQVSRQNFWHSKSKFEFSFRMVGKKLHQPSIRTMPAGCSGRRAAPRRLAGEPPIRFHWPTSTDFKERLSARFCGLARCPDGEQGDTPPPKNGIITREIRHVAELKLSSCPNAHPTFQIDIFSHQKLISSIAAGSSN